MTHPSSRAVGESAALGLFALVTAALGYELAIRYISRLSHHEGFALVAVQDEVHEPRPTRPRQTAFIVVDGLRLDAALTMASTAHLRRQGQCARTWVGVPSVSRPVYAVLSTGLEQDRTGARNNDETSPLRAESFWEVARQAGLEVEARSELPWWRQLFPRGFTSAIEVPRDAVVFPARLSADLTLLHPVYVDETAHEHGAASPAYGQAVRRVDGEIEALLATMDLTRDLVVLTADHGHRDRGGHGGPGPEVTHVLTCLAGAGVARREDLLPLDARSVAPAMTLLLGLRFPRHMRAGDDDLDAVFRLAAISDRDEPYRRDRREAVARFRDANRRALNVRSDGPHERWSDAYTAAGRRQAARGLAVGALVVGALGWWGRTRRAALGWAASVALAFVALYAILAGGLDTSSINQRAFFVRNALGAGLTALGLGYLTHAAGGRPWDTLRDGSAGLVALALGANGAHLAAYGWPLGWPLPPPSLYFAPFLATSLLCVAGLGLAMVSALTTARRWRSRG